MFDDLRKARKLAESLRYSGDVALKNNGNGDGSLIAIRSYFYQNCLCISREVTPTLSKRLGNVLQRLKIPDTVVEAFVYPSPEIQATCVSKDSSSCVIRFSSMLVETLNSEEFEFVAGHELGHFLLRHSMGSSGQDNLEYFMQSRAQEISADRLGLIACKSLEIAIRAMMKTMSGLTSQHLRFDVGTFVSQIKNHLPHSDIQASHPSMLIRCRALLWFSSIDSKYSDKYLPKNTRIKLDERIETDFQNYVDGPIRKKIELAKKNFSMWLTVRHIADDRNFSKKEQEKFASLFGDQELESLKNYLKAISATQIQGAIDERVNDARKALSAIIPKASAEEMAKIERSVREQLS